MIKHKLRVFLILVVLFVTATTIAVIANDPIGSTFDFTIYTQIENGVPVGETAIPNKLYGSTVTFDAGTVNTNYDFVMYTVNGKIEFGLPESNTFIVYYELYVNVIYRDQSNFMVAFIDANQDLLEMKFVPSDGFSDAESSTMEPFNPIPGYVISDIEPWTGGSLLDVTEDRVLWVNYVPDSTSPLVTENLYLTVTDGTADLTEYSFNQVATVNADDIPLSNFQYWEKDGMIVSYNQEYSFTMLENTAITAVFAQTPSPNADILFINLISYSDIFPPFITCVGQFNVPEDNTLVEYGVIISANYTGEITLDPLNTPDVSKIQSYKYNPITNEFVIHVNQYVYGYSVRGYMITTDGSTETITYSDVPS